MEMNKNLLYGDKYEDMAELIEVVFSELGYNQSADVPNSTNYTNYTLKNVIAVFDSESSNYVTEADEKKPFIVSEAMTFMSISNNKNVNVLFRSMPNFAKFLAALSQYLKLKVTKEPYRDKYGSPITDCFGNVIYNTSEDVYLPIFVHNLSFDASFLMPVLPIWQTFASDLHSPYYFITDNGFLFKDTAVLTQCSLAELGYKLRKFTVKKQVGDFNYDIIRKPSTPFTHEEEGYVLNDILVLAAYMREFLEDYHNDLGAIPLTQTGIVRRFLQEAADGSWSTWLKLNQDGIINDEVILEELKKWLKSTRDGKKLVQVYKSTQAILKDFKAHKVTAQVKDKSKIVKLFNKFLTYLGEGDQSFEYDLDAFKMMKASYQGGFTHANPLHTGAILKDVQSFDFTSSYPTRILSQKFASSAPLKLTPQELLGLTKLMAEATDDQQLLNKLYLFEVKVAYLTLKDGVNDGYLSDYHTEGQKDLVCNGRIFEGHHLTFTTTSIDWAIISQCYNMKGVQFTKGYVFKQDYLPRFLVASTTHFYTSKTKLKHVNGREADYMRSKQMLNSCYGCMVSDIVRPDVTYNPLTKEWGKFDYYKAKDQDNLTKEVIKKAQQKSFLYYIWGVEVSAYARTALWRGILGVGDDYVYSDTDSLKLLHPKNHLDLINQENTLIVNQIKACLQAKGIDPQLSAPKDIEGKVHQLGVWDPQDAFYLYFKTLGAKRYIAINEDRSFGITIAGLSKKKGAQYILKASRAKVENGKVLLADDNIKKIFNFFNSGMYVPAGKTGKLGSFYIDHYDAFTFDGEKIPAGGGCLLQPVDFTMSLNESFEQVLLMYAQGFTVGSSIKPSYA